MSALMTATWLASPEPALLAAESESSGSGADFLWLLGVVLGVGFYVVTYLRYRNIGERHEYERQTACTVEGMITHDAKKDHVSGVSNSRLSGENAGSPRKRLGSGSSWTEL
jgi:predicted outer membrane lipoprotein